MLLFWQSVEHLFDQEADFHEGHMCRGASRRSAPRNCVETALASRQQLEAMVFRDEFCQVRIKGLSQAIEEVSEAGDRCVSCEALDESCMEEGPLSVNAGKGDWTSAASYFSLARL